MQLKDAVQTQGIAAKYTQLFNLLNLGAYNGTAEFLQWELYDRITFTAADVAAAKKDYVFFNGTTGTTKTLADTNMEGSRQMPNGQHLEAKAIQLQIFKQSVTPATEVEITELLQLIDNAVITVGIANKAPMLLATLSRLLGMSLTAYTTNTVVTTSDSTFRQISNGQYVLNIPIVLPALVNFDVKLTLGSAITANLENWSIRFGFQGAMIRGL